MPQAKGTWYAGQWWSDPRGTRAWRKLRDQAIREEPICWLRLPGCTTRATTGDHILTFKERPDLAMERSNIRGACASCNHRRNDTPIEQLKPTINPEALAFFD